MARTGITQARRAHQTRRVDLNPWISALLRKGKKQSFELQNSAETSVDVSIVEVLRTSGLDVLY